MIDAKVSNLLRRDGIGKGANSIVVEHVDDVAQHALALPSAGTDFPTPSLPSPSAGTYDIGSAMPRWQRGSPSGASRSIQARSMTGYGRLGPLLAAVRAYHPPVGGQWCMDETYLKIGGRWRYVYRAIDEHGQIVDVYLSDRRNASAAQAFFEQAINTSSVTPTQVTTDKAKSYPKALRAVLPTVEHRSSKYLNNRLERDHQHLKGRVRPMRRFKTVASAANFCRGHMLIRNLARGFGALSAHATPRLGLPTAWAARATNL